MASLQTRRLFSFDDVPYDTAEQKKVCVVLLTKLIRELKQVQNTRTAHRWHYTVVSLYEATSPYYHCKRASRKETELQTNRRAWFTNYHGLSIYHFREYLI